MPNISAYNESLTVTNLSSIFYRYLMLFRPVTFVSHCALQIVVGNLLHSHLVNKFCIFVNQGVAEA